MVDLAASTAPAAAVTPTVGPVETLSGTVGVALGDPLPLVSNTTFDLTQLAATSSGLWGVVMIPWRVSSGPCCRGSRFDSTCS